MGLNGEAGEAIDILKKHLFQGHELDTEHMAKELGDVAWYLAVSANAIGYDLETIMQMNVDKLKARYPYGFDAEHSLHRNQDDI
jgi:NTP pyrophosphatase (non-canonical NTP hydrolase)